MTHSSHLWVRDGRLLSRRGAWVFSLAVAVFTFVSGFGALITLDLLTQPLPGTPRLYSFWFTMLGYSLFLPGALAGWFLLRAQFPPSRAGRLVGTLVGLLAAASMFYCQVVWLIDPEPRSNWTLTAPHRFNLLGWYNAMFTVGIFALLGYLVGDLLTRLNSGSGIRGMTKGRRQAGLGGLALALAGLAGFGATVLLDNVGYMQHASSQATVVNTFIVTGVMALVLWLMRPDNRSLHAEPPR